MRVRRIRLDLAICMFLAFLVCAGVFKVWEWTCDKGFYDGFFAMFEGNKVEIAEGETGGYPTEDTPRVNSFSELMTYADSFTMEVDAVRLYNYGTISGESADWRIMRLDDDVMVALKVNEDNIQKTEDGKLLLPVGEIVLETPEIIDELEDTANGKGYSWASDGYIDMLGEAKQSTVSEPLAQGVMVAISLLPVVFFAIYMVLVFGIHAIFCKMGIFPPVFAKREQ